MYGREQLLAEIEERLFALQDLSYREFHSRLVPTVQKEKIIGVRTPTLRGYAKELAKHPQKELFLQRLPHRYYEENNLHGMLLAAMKDYEACVEGLDIFLPYIDNWGTCDMISPVSFKKNLSQLEEKVWQWLGSEHTYTIRFAVTVLMKYYLDEAFLPKYLSWAADVQSEEYYVKMSVAWFLATALAKQYETAVPFLLENRLDVWTHNKTIQKAVESYRISEETKAYLKSLKRDPKKKE